MSTESKHMPGPWDVLGEDELAGIEFVEISSGELGASNHRTIGWIGCGPDGISDEDRANARLIAAAPDLLAAVMARTEARAFAAAVSADTSDGEVPPKHIMDKAEALFAKAELLEAAAIAKAEGRP
jgi:hypothetical protein